MFRIDNAFYFTGQGIEAGQELYEFLKEAHENSPHPVENTSNEVKTLLWNFEGKGLWSRDYTTEMYCDMSASEDDILRQAYDAHCRLCTGMPSFSVFIQNYKVVQGKGWE